MLMPAIVAYSAIFPPSPDNEDNGKMAETKTAIVLYRYHILSHILHFRQITELS